jgi:hypothetical protein
VEESEMLIRFLEVVCGINKKKKNRVEAWSKRAQPEANQIWIQ